MAVKRGMAGVSAMDGWVWEREDRKQPRVVTADEETALLDAADKLYGFRCRTFMYTALYTGGRRGELLRLSWWHVDLDGTSVTFTETKGKRDRVVLIGADVVDLLRRLQAMTLQAGGPFIGMDDNLSRQWGRIRKAAGVPDVTIHDLRRSYVTRLIRSGAQPDVVQALAGHSSLNTTMTYYTSTKDSDKREDVAKLRRDVV